jgi:hypothetical protein
MAYTDPSARMEANAKRRMQYHRRKRWIDVIKMSSGCVQCGYKKHPAALDFNHIDPTTKKFLIPQRLAATKLTRLFSEIRKCEILCANCHRIHSNEQWWSNITRRNKPTNDVQV